MQNEKWKGKTLSRYLHRKKLRLRLFASHIKFIFLGAILRFLAALFRRYQWKLMGNSKRLAGNPTKIDHRHAEATCALLISSLFVSDRLRQPFQWPIGSWKSRSCCSSAFLCTNLCLVRHWNDKRLCIHQVYISMELFNFPFDVVVAPLIIIRSR
jgi:hypothetical protein